MTTRCTTPVDQTRIWNRNSIEKPNRQIKSYDIQRIDLIVTNLRKLLILEKVRRPHHAYDNKHPRKQTNIWNRVQCEKITLLLNYCANHLEEKSVTRKLI